MVLIRPSIPVAGIDYIESQIQILSGFGAHFFNISHLVQNTIESPSLLLVTGKEGDINPLIDIQLANGQM